MKTKGNTVLITGGATGIGFALAKRFVELENKVIICGRRKEKLETAAKELGTVEVIRCDISKEEERARLFEAVSSGFDNLNVLVNNAGIQMQIDLRNGIDGLLVEDEIETNLKAPIYLTARFMPLLMKNKATIINVSSGLGLVPMARFPIYCATKAAMHSFSLSLRQQLKDIPIKVFEVIPPTVYDTELKGKEMERSEWSISSAEMADATIKGLKAEQYEIYAGGSAAWATASKSELDSIFRNINR